MKITIILLFFINLYGYEIERIEKEIVLENKKLDKKITENKKNITKLKKENEELFNQIMKNREAVYRLKNIKIPLKQKNEKEMQLKMKWLHEDKSSSGKLN